jgi:dihydrofolate synthase/folylpolyglutamate synthase
MNGAEILASLSRRGLFRIKPGLERMQAMMHALGDPQDSYPTLHIAGTNGKGSVAAALESVLRTARQKTGLYISPHLCEIRERIQINGSPIDQRTFESLAKTIYRAELAHHIQLTYFEFFTAMAFVAFRHAHVDIAVVEVGMGGLWDATNLIRQPLMSIITSIGMDHSAWLGSSRDKIASQKAGIIKPNGMAISGVLGSPAVKIAAVARKQKATLRQVGEDFRAERIQSAWHLGKQTGRYHNKEGVSFEFVFGLVGTHQIDNAAIVIDAVKQLQLRGWKITDDDLKQGLAKVFWPGRFSVLHRPGQPTVLLDGAHNPDAMRAFLTTLQQSPWRSVPKTVVFSAFKDKDYTEMARLLKRSAQKYVLCGLPGSRGLAVKELRKAFKGISAPLETAISPSVAMRRAVAITKPDHLIIVTGSLALVGLILKELHPLTFHRHTPVEKIRELAHV